MKLTTLERLALDTELEGHKPGSAQFEAVLRQKKVQLCVERSGLVSCSQCPACDSCEVLKAYLRDLRYGVEI